MKFKSTWWYLQIWIIAIYISGSIAIHPTGDEKEAVPNIITFPCEDKDVMCPVFAKSSQCESMPEFMQEICPKSCNLCMPPLDVGMPSSCKDLHYNCSNWAARGDCHNYHAGIMKHVCPVSCYTCPPKCIDQHESCFLGAMNGQCDDNPCFFLKYCVKSCKHKFPLYTCGKVSGSTVEDVCDNPDQECGGGSIVAVSRINKRETRTESNFQNSILNKKNTMPDFSEKLDVATAVIKEFGGNFSMVDDYLDNFSFESEHMTPQMMYGLEQLGAKIWSSPSLDGKFQVIQSFLENENLVPRSLKKRQTTASSLCNQRSGGILQSTVDFNWCKTIFGGIVAISTLMMNPLQENSRSVRSADHASNPNAPFYSVSSSSHFNVDSHYNGRSQDKAPSHYKAPSNYRAPPLYTPPPSTAYSTPPPPKSYSTTPPPKCTNQADCDRTLVPFCSADGYLEMVERHKRLSQRNTCLPWSPIAEAISLALNFCQFGVGSNDTLCDVPLPPKQHDKTYEARVLLGHARDRRAPRTEPYGYEAPDTSQCGFALEPEHAAEDINDDPEKREAPKKWPGVSFPKFRVSNESKSTPTPDPAPVTATGPPKTVTSTTQTPSGTPAPSPTGPPAPLTSTGTLATTQIPSGAPAPSPTGPPAPLTSDQAGDNSIDGDVDLRGPIEPTDDRSISRKKRQSDSSKPTRVTRSSQNDRDSFVCGGAPITPYHVLTAAHCLGQKKPPDVIRLGENDFERDDESTAFDYDVADITIHEGYKFPQKYNDIAILTLKQKIEFGANGFQPFCLPKSEMSIDDRNCTVSGWGTRPNTRKSTVLINVTVTVVPAADCQELYSGTPSIIGAQYPQGIIQGLLCAGVINDVCRGDSGGPLVFRETGDSMERQVGIVSSGYGCGDVKFPGIYTRIDQYLSWIEKVTRGDCQAMQSLKKRK